MPSIKIISTPPGEAPEEMRRAWVGLVMPVAEVTDEEVRSKYGVVPCDIFGNPSEKEAKREVYRVDTRVALAILRAANQEACRWFEKFVNPEGAPFLRFEKGSCELC
jgi:hypothetical protein